jgi:putative ABC transport system permease protein
MHSVRVAVRSLLKSPGFTFAAIATMTLAVGAATAVWSVARAVLLEPLPYKEPERIVRFIGASEQEGRYEAVSYPDMKDVIAQSGVFESAAAFDEWSPSIIGEGDAEVLVGGAVDSGFFDVLGIKPARGRFFVATEDVPGADTTVVISHELWQRKFGGQEDIAGTAVRIDKRVLTIAGVTPRGFVHPHLSDNTRRIDIWTTLAIDPATDQAPRSGRAFTGIARLRRGVTVEQAAARVKTIMKRLEQTYPESNTNRSMTVVPLHQRVVQFVQRPVWLLFAAVLLLLLIACVNVANLMLARVSARGADLAVRAALGARGRHLFFPLLAETMCIALAGAAFGVFVAHVAVRFLGRAAAGVLPRAESVSINIPVAAFAIASAVISALLIAAIPAVRQWRGLRAVQLRGRGTSDDAASLSAHSSLVVVQVALCVVLLMAATLVGRSLWNLLDVDTGIDDRGVFAFSVRAPSTSYPEYTDVPKFYDELQRKLLELPGVRAAGATTILPFDGEENGMGYTVDGRPAPAPGQGPSAEQRWITPGYFEAIGIPIVQGRAFTHHDDADAPRVVIIDETLARNEWPNESPVGKRITVFGESHEIVGIAKSAQILIVGEPAVPVYYTAWKQEPRRRTGHVVVRSSAPKETLLPAIRAVVASISPDAPVMNPRTFDAVVGDSLSAQKLRTTLLSLFGVAALLLAGVGVAGVLATNVARRRREIGVRMALGATTREIASFVVKRGMRMVTIGLIAGALLSLLTNRVVQSMLFGVGTTDPISMLVVASLLATAGLIAAAVPALRAASTDPMTVMRTE